MKSEGILWFMTSVMSGALGWRSMMMVDQTAVVELNIDDFTQYRILTGNPVPYETVLVALAVDYENNRFFVSVYSQNTSNCSIFRMNYDSSNWQNSEAWDKTHVLHGSCVEGLAFSDGRLYGTDATQDYVFTCLPDGYDFQEIVNASDRTTPRGIIVSDGYVYWTEYLKSESDWTLDRASGGIFRLPLSGNGDRESVIDGVRLKHPSGIDINGGFLFWADAGIDQIGMVDLTTKQNTRLMAQQNFPSLFSILYISDPTVPLLAYTEWSEDLLVICTGYYQPEGNCFRVAAIITPYDIELTFPTAQDQHDLPTTEATTERSTPKIPTIAPTEESEDDESSPFTTRTTTVKISPVASHKEDKDDDWLWILIMVGLALIVAVLLLIFAIVAFRFIQGSSHQEGSGNDSDGVYNCPVTGADVELEQAVEHGYDDVASESDVSVVVHSNYKTVGYSETRQDSQGQLLPDPAQAT